MNKRFYKIVFNKKRAQLMAVAETASSNSKSPGTKAEPRSNGPSLLANLRPLSFALMLGLGLVSLVPTAANAQVVADPNAPKSQQANVGQAGNGVPLINIQTPSAAGVSRNTYTQFDVQHQGVILNNARTNSQTQLGGWIQGNPNLAGGTARVILNEVNSSNPTQLKGFVEVGGDRAQVVIANPAGITCNGCGFINTQRATLTTGTPIINNGGIDGYRVQGGTIRIEGDGLDATQADYTDLIARAVEVNAGVWASQLKVTTGANQVNADNTSATPIAGTGASSEFAIDVAQLGGMYANKIVLVGTETGVGVRNAGQIGASAGDVAITADGRLVNSGQISSAGSIHVDANTGIDNSGTIFAQGNTQVTTHGSLNNANATIAANGALNVSANALDNTHGTLGSAHANVAIDTGSGALNNQSGYIVAAQDLNISTTGIDNVGGAIGAGNVNIDTHNQSIDNTQGQIIADGALAMQSGALTNDGGLIQAQGAINIDTHGQGLSNKNSGTANGILGLSTVKLATGHLDNAAGFIGAATSLTINATDVVNNTAGVVSSSGDLDVSANTIDNQGSLIQGSGAVKLQVSGAVDNKSGLIHADQTLNVTAHQIDNSATQNSQQGIEGQSLALAADQINNNTGAIRADQILSITSGGALDNTSGLLSSADSLEILDSNASPVSNAGNKTLSLANTNGTLIAGSSLLLDSASLNGNGHVLSQNDLTIKLLGDVTQSGEITANHNASIETTGTFTNTGTAQAGETLTVHAGSIDNQASGQISALNTNLQATDSHTLNNRGLIDGSNTYIDAVTLNNLGTGRIYGDHIAIAATTLSNDAENGIAPVIAARSRLDIGADTIANRNDALILSAGDISIGGALDASQNATGSATTLNNNSATIQALGNLSISANQINNTNEHFSYESQLASTENGLQDNLSSSQYRVYNRYTYVPVITQTAPGQLLAGEDIGINADTILNANSRIIAGGALNIGAANLINQGTDATQKVVDSGTTYTWGITGQSCHWVWFHKDCSNNWGWLTSSYYAVHNTSMVIGTGIGLQNTNPGGANAPIDDLAITSVSLTPSTTGTSTGPGNSVRSGGVNTTLPNNSLFSQASNPTATYLIETDPRFANYRTWLSSDYMLNALAIDPANSQKRIGDGFYEQKLVQEQIAQLTGRRFLEGYSSNEAEYQALMNNALTVYESLQLRPGIALTAEQVAQLTSDIVWLVEKNVTLPNGQTAKALVPQVYVRVQDGDLTGNGALLSGNSVNINLSGDLNNAGTIGGRNLVSLNAENLSNLGGRISGTDVSLHANADLNNLGGRIDAINSLVATAGHDLNVVTATRSADSSAGANTFSRTNLDRVAGLYVSGDNGILVASAGNDMNLMAAAIANAPSSGNTASAGTTVLAAGNDINLGTVRQATQDNLVWDGKNWRKDASYTDVGSAIQAQGDIQLQAGNNINAKAAEVTSSQGAVALGAGNDIKLSAGEAMASVDEAHQHTLRGFWSKTTTTTRDTSLDVNAVNTTLSGDSVSADAGRDIVITGGKATAQQGIELTAARDIAIDTTKEAHTESHYSQTVKKASGFGQLMGAVSLLTGDAPMLSMLGAAGAMTNKTTTQESNQKIDSVLGSTLSGNTVSVASGRNTRVAGSTVVADGNVDVNAGGDLAILSAQETGSSHSSSSSKSSGFIGTFWQPAFGTVKQNQTEDKTDTTQIASQVASLNGDVNLVAAKNYTQTASDVLAPQGNVAITAQDVTIQAADNTQSDVQTQQFRKVSIGGTVNIPVVDAIKSMRKTSKAASQTGDARMQALAAATLAMQAKAAYDAAKTMAGGNAAGIKVGVSLGSSKSESRSEQSSSTAAGSTVVAGNNVSITATGAGENSNVAVQGSKIQAGNDVTLSADNAITLAAAQNTADQRSSNSSSGASIGVAYSMGGSQNGFTLEIGGNKGRGKADGADVSWTPTTVSAGNVASLTSGGDTNIVGSTVAGKQVIADVGGDLNIQSLQDTSTYDAKQSSASIGISLCIPPFCYGTSSVSGGVSNAKMQGDYASVNTQAGIQAGDKGFQVAVAGNTDLKGAQIASNQNAIDAEFNTLTTKTLTVSDIQNHDNYKAEGYSLSGSISGSLGDQSTASAPADQAAAKTAANSKPTAAAGIGSAQGNQASTTHSGISGATITITDDAAQQALTGQDGATTVASLNRDTGAANSLTKSWNGNALLQDVQAQAQITATFGQQASKAIGDYAKTQTDKADQLRAQAVQAKLAGQDEQAAALDQQAQALDAQWGDQGSMRLLAHTLVGGLTGGTNGALGAATSTLAAPEIAKALSDAGLDPSLTKTLTAIATTTLGATVGGTQGAAAASNEVVNNYLKHDEAIALASLREKKLNGKCDASCQQEIDQLKQRDEQRNKVLEACRGVSSQVCNDARQEVRNAAAEYIRKETFALNSGGIDLYRTYATENNETRQYADSTLDGKLQGTAAGAADTAVSAVKAVGSLVGNLLGSALGDEASQQALKNGAGAAWDYVKNPDNWPYLVGAMTPEQREQLAKAYETGDGYTVGKLTGEQAINILSNIPSGGAAGTIKLVKAADKAEEIAAAASKMERSAATIAEEVSTKGQQANLVEQLAGRPDINQVMEVSAGSKGNWDSLVNGKLESNTAYVLDNGHAYVTDASGRVKEVTGDLNLTAMDRNGYQQLCAGKSGCVGDDGGHLIASSLGGAGDRINIVPQASTLNRGDWKSMENYLRNQLNAGKEVSVKIDVRYPASGGVRPNEFKVTALISGIKQDFTFKQ